MQPLLPDFDFSNQNSILLLKASRSILNAFPKGKSLFDIFGADYESIPTSFGINISDFDNIVDNLYKLWAFLIYHQLKEEEFHQNLSKVQINKELQEKFVELWLNDGKSAVERVAKFSCTAAPFVENVHCTTQMRLSSNVSNEIREPELTLHLDTNQGEKKITISREQATILYQELNNVQAALDDLVG